MPQNRPKDNESFEFESTIHVFDRARQGNLSAGRVLLGRTLEPLRRWARGRLPAYARGNANTEDVVQDVIVRALGNIPRFEHRSVGALLVFLRKSVLNRIRDEIRKVSRHGVPDELVDEHPDAAYSPLEQLILKEEADRYLEALRRLRPDERLILILRLEHRQSFDEIATRVGKSTPDAARMAFNRVLKKLAAELGIDAPPELKH